MIFSFIQAGDLITGEADLTNWPQWAVLVVVLVSAAHKLGIPWWRAFTAPPPKNGDDPIPTTDRAVLIEIRGDIKAARRDQRDHNKAHADGIRRNGENIARLDGRVGRLELKTQSIPDGTLDADNTGQGGQI